MDDFEKKYFSLLQSLIINFLFLIFIIWIDGKIKELSHNDLYSKARIDDMIYHSNIIFWGGIGMYNLLRLNAWLKENNELYNLGNYIITILILAYAIKLAGY